MRADKFFAEKYGSRTKAAQIIARGLIKRNGKVLSPSDDVKENDVFELPEISDFVSGGGNKLERGLSHFSVDVSGKIFVDLGASTGGFTDCLLRRGVKRVYCVDVGTSQLAPEIASKKEVIVMDGTNARYLTKRNFPEKIDGIVSDLSFISLRLILPVIFDVLEVNGEAFVLFKPQFECEGKNLTKHGILPVAHHKKLLATFYDFAISLGLPTVDIVNAPIRERKNVEYIVRLQKGGRPIDCETFLKRAATLI